MGDETYSGAESGGEIYGIEFVWSGDALERDHKLQKVRCDGKNLVQDSGFHWLADWIVQWRDETEKAAYVKDPLSLTMYEQQCIMLHSNRFLYMDVGKWLAGEQYFGLIAGNNAFVCKYNPQDPCPSWSQIGGPLDDFFTLPGVSIPDGNWKKIPPPFPPDPNHLFLILPDMHVPAVPFDCPPGLDRDRWANLNKWDYFDSRSSIDAMVKFLRKVRALGIAGSITLVQIGDMYELWAGRGEKPYFQTLSDAEYLERLENNRPLVIVDPYEVDLVATFVWQAHKTHCELFMEFDACAGSGMEMIFLYGNHDSYMACNDVVASAQQMIQQDEHHVMNPGMFTPVTIYNPTSTVYPRVKDVTLPGLFLEHGQRVDAYNRDGNPDGVAKTDQAVRYGKATSLLDSTRRESFVTGAATYWATHQMSFGLYVQGHTHSPVLKYVDVSHFREDVIWELSGDNYIIERTKTPIGVTQ